MVGCTLELRHAVYAASSRPLNTEVTERQTDTTKEGMVESSSRSKQKRFKESAKNKSVEQTFRVTKAQQTSRGVCATAETCAAEGLSIWGKPVYFQTMAIYR